MEVLQRAVGGCRAGHRVREELLVVLVLRVAQSSSAMLSHIDAFDWTHADICCTNSATHMYNRSFCISSCLTPMFCGALPATGPILHVCPETRFQMCRHPSSRGTQCGPLPLLVTTQPSHAEQLGTYPSSDFVGVVLSNKTPINIFLSTLAIE